MPQLLSPGVLTREIDLTTIVPGVSSNDGAIAGVFRWGPVGELINIDSEDALVTRFGKPTNLNAETWFTAASFLAYGDSLYVSRAANTIGISPDFDCIVTANDATVKITGDGASINVTSLGLKPGLVLLATTQNNVYLASDARIDDIINSTAFSLSSASEVTTIAGANTLTVPVTIDSGTNATTLVTLAAGSNTGELAVGYKIVSSSNNDVVNSGVQATIASIVNSTAVEVTADIIVASGNANLVIAKGGTLSVQFVSNTTFNAIANTGRVANLEYAIITSKDAFTHKEGNIDSDVKFIARWPGELGNSLRVSVCGNSEGFHSHINLATYASRVSLPVYVNSNTAVLRVMGANSEVVAANCAQLKSLLQVTDTIEVGNTLLGSQFMKITSISNTTTKGAAANVVLSVTCTKEETLAAVASTTDLLPGMTISAAANSYMLDMVCNNVTNATHFNFTTVPSVNLTSSSITFSPTSYFTIQFEDPYSLGDDYKFVSSNTQTRDLVRTWEFHNVLDSAPGQSDYVITFGNSSINSDELHIVVVDDGGKFTGVPGTILEIYRNVSRATDGKTPDGEQNHWKNVINTKSQYMWAVNDLSGADSATAENLEDSTLDVVTYTFNYGKDGADESNIAISLLTNAWDKFKSKEDIDISLVLAGRTRSFVLANYLIDNLVEFRQDCVLFVSPQKADVVNNPGNEAAACVEFRNLLRSTSYAVLDSGMKYMYDRYNDTYRWIPLNGDTAGLCARTDDTNDPWWSPAGFNRGQIKNVVKLAWNPRQTARDILYKNGVNPIVQFLGEGTIMYGDKTLLHKPSAFDRINVRRLFIVLRKAIAEAAKYTLFEFNDAFTRATFKNMVNPYLRDIKGRRGIYDFLVVCDETNNTPVVIDRNEFIGDIYIKPARSINFIYLNFIAVPTGVAFSEMVGKF